MGRRLALSLPNGSAVRQVGFVGGVLGGTFGFGPGEEEVEVAFALGVFEQEVNNFGFASFPGQLIVHGPKFGRVVAEPAQFVGGEAGGQQGANVGQVIIGGHDSQIGKYYSPPLYHFLRGSTSRQQRFDRLPADPHLLGWICFIQGDI